MANPVIRSLQIDILKKHIGPFFFCFLIIMFLLLMQFLFLHIDKLVGKGLPMSIIIELILTNLAYMVVLAVPMSVLVSTLIAFGKTSELHEMTAIKAAGINPLSIIRPVLLLGAGLMVFLIWFSNEVLPEANYKARSLFIDIRMQRPGFDLKQNVFYDGINSFNFLVRHIPAGTDSLFDVTLFQEANRERNAATIRANKGYLTSVEDTDILSLFLFDGKIHRVLSETPDGKPRTEITRFEEYRINFDLSELSFTRTDHTTRRRDDRTMSSQAMLAVIDSLNLAMDKDRITASANKGSSKALEFLLQSAERKQPQSHFNDSTHSNGDIVLASSVAESESDKSSEVITPQNDSTEITLELHKVDSDKNSEESVKTPFFVLNQVDGTSEKRQAVRRTTSSMRNSVSQLITVNNSFEWRIERIAQYMVEVHKKVSIPAACIIFVLIGAPLGILTRNGNLGVAALLAIIIFTYYWIGIIQGEKLADRLIISPFIGMWFANITLFILGIYLMAKVMYDFRLSGLWRKRR